MGVLDNRAYRVESDWVCWTTEPIGWNLVEELIIPWKGRCLGAASENSFQDAECKVPPFENPKLSKEPAFKLGVGQNVALHVKSPLLRT